MAITIGWWLAPLLVTLIGLGVAAWMNKDSGGGPIDAAFSLFNMLLFGAVPALIAWLVWALLR